MTSARKYDVYGGMRQLTGGNGTRHKFVGNLGHPSDDETGLIYMRARYYDPVTGRFASEDPAASGANWYSYCDNNPISLVDSTGKFKQYTLLEGLGRVAYVVGFEIGILFTLSAFGAATAKNPAAVAAFCSLAIAAFAAAINGASMNGYQASVAEIWGQWGSSLFGGGSALAIPTLLACAAKSAGDAATALETTAGRMAAPAIVGTLIYGMMVAGAIHAVDGF